MKSEDKPKMAFKRNNGTMSQIPEFTVQPPPDGVAPISERIRERLARQDLIREMQFSFRQGQILRQSRCRKGFNQKQFVQALKLSTRLLSKMENGTVGIPCDLLFYARQYLDGIFQKQIEDLSIELSVFISTQIRQRLMLH